MGDREIAESVRIPARTGAQQLDAMPEKMPNAKNPGVIGLR